MFIFKRKLNPSFSLFYASIFELRARMSYNFFTPSTSPVFSSLCFFLFLPRSIASSFILCFFFILPASFFTPFSCSVINNVLCSSVCQFLDDTKKLAILIVNAVSWEWVLPSSLNVWFEPVIQHLPASVLKVPSYFTRSTKFLFS